jgi:hypothetical protein
MKSKSLINYQKYLDEAMHDIVKRVLTDVKKNGIPGNHHFYISFVTHAKGVVITDHLKEKYKDTITIILQHQYENLQIFEHHFEVTLSFDGKKEDIRVPFKAMTSFLDPSVRFVLQFDQSLFNEELETLYEEPKSSNKNEKVISFNQLKNKKNKKHE